MVILAVIPYRFSEVHQVNKNDCIVKGGENRRSFSLSRTSKLKGGIITVEVKTVRERLFKRVLAGR